MKHHPSSLGDDWADLGHGLRKALVRMLALFRIFVFPTPQAAVYNLTHKTLADSFPEPDRLQAIEFLHARGNVVKP